MGRSTNTATERPELDAPPPAADGDGQVAPLSRERIIRVAITLLDTEGLAGLSMRRLADRLDAGAMSLYWYFSTKDELLAATTEAVLGEIRLQHLGDDWRGAIRSIASDIRAAIRRHPWLRQTLSSHPAVGPHGLAVFEAILLTLGEIGLEGHRLDVAATTLIGFVIGFAVNEDVWVDAFQVEGQAGLTFPPGLLAEQPVLDAYFADSTRRDPDHRFEAGINLVLAGIEADAAGEATGSGGGDRS